MTAGLEKEGLLRIIAGPCSAESEEQVMTVGRALKADGRTDLYRAGVWKPRTRPNSFEGRGIEALEWLCSMRSETGLKVCVEVANSEHVEAALKAEVDVLWVGARTTVSPFAVQEIADAMSGTSTPVMIKNPVNPDIDLWMGAVERFRGAGVQVDAVIHRGFSSPASSYRNAPMWEIPVSFMTDHGDIPMICDPSHIGGARKHLKGLAQKALDLNYAGLMIETHPDPDNALSDRAQQLTPEALIDLFDNLTVRSNASKPVNALSELETLRGRIDKLDTELIAALAKRMEVVKAMGALKKENDLTIFQVERWREMLQSRLPMAERNHLDHRFMELLLQLIHQESIRVQSGIYADES